MIEQTTADGKGRAPQARGHRATVLVRSLLVGITAMVVAWVILNGYVGIHREDGRITTVQDFGSHLRFTRTTWSGAFHGDSPSLYTADAHLRMMEEWAAEPVEHALPFGYSPTMLWVLGPLSAFPLPVAYVLWSLAGLVAALWVVSRKRVHRLVGPMILLSPVGLASVALGQTAILAAAGFLFLMDRSLRATGDPPPWRGMGWLAAVAVLWALGGKPPLAVAAGAAMLATRDIRTVAAAVALTVVTTVALTPWIGTAWPADYLHLLSTYNWVQADPAFAGSLRPVWMTNLRAALFVIFGAPDDIAARVSNPVWALSLMAIVWAGRTRRVSEQGVWALSLLSFLVLCSHVTFTEDLLLLLVPAALATRPGTAEWSRAGVAAGVLIALGLFFNPVIGPLPLWGPMPLLVVKLGLVAWVLRATVVRRSGASAPSAEGRSFPGVPAGEPAG